MADNATSPGKVKKGVLLPVILDRKYARSDEKCDVELLEVSDHAIQESVRAHTKDAYRSTHPSKKRTVAFDMAVFAGTDALSLLMASLLSSLIAGATGGHLGFEYWMFMQLPVMWVVGSQHGLYPGWGLSQVSELRKVTLATSAVYFVTLLYLAGSGNTAGTSLAAPMTSGPDGSIPVFSLIIGFVLSTILIFSTRRVTASRLAASAYGGHPVAIYGAAEAGREVARSIARDIRSGLRPVAFLDDDPGLWGRKVEGIPVLGDTNIVVPEATAAIVALPNTSTDNLHSLMAGPLSYYINVTSIPEHSDIAARKIRSFDGGQYFGIDLSKKPLHPDHQGAKRALDIAIVFLSAPFWLPALLLLGCVGVFENHTFPVRRFLHTTERRREIWMYKFQASFRTQALLKRLSLGKLLYLPSIVNLFNGSMSVVGPVTWQVRKQGDFERDHDSSEKSAGGTGSEFARPGLVGLAPLSEIFATVSTDVEQTRYYVRNWSPWLDLLIIGKTIRRLLGS